MQYNRRESVRVNKGIFDPLQKQLIKRFENLYNNKKQVM